MVKAAGEGGGGEIGGRGGAGWLLPAISCIPARWDLRAPSAPPPAPPVLGGGGAGCPERRVWVRGGGAGAAPTPAALPAAGGEVLPAQGAPPRRASAGRERPLSPALSRSGRCPLDR